MARLNTAVRNPVFTHEGAPAAANLSAEKQLRRSVLSCLLWEDEHYESGQKIADRIADLAAKVKPPVLAALAVEAREVMNLRHVPLLLLEVLTRTGSGSAVVGDTIDRVIQRADEIGEFLAIYWHGGGRNTCEPGHGKSMSAQTLRGLRKALARFNEYALGKYDRDGKVKLRDALRLGRPRPKDDAQSALWKRVKDRTLAVPDTWEVALSGGADKREAFTRLLQEGKLGYLALLRNLRNMAEAGVDTDLVRSAIIARRGGAQRVLPFRYVAAARAAPQFEPVLDHALCEAIAEMPVLPGKTVVLVDVSGSMDAKLSAKSDMTRMDAAATLASIIPGDLRVYTFSNYIGEVPARRGMAGVDVIKRSQPHGGTMLGLAMTALNMDAGMVDRIIVITDEQSHDRVPDPLAKRAYMVNIASAKNGVGYNGRWNHIDGWSEGVLRYIHEFERQDDR